MGLMSDINNFINDGKGSVPSLVADITGFKVRNSATPDKVASKLEEIQHACRPEENPQGKDAIEAKNHRREALHRAIFDSPQISETSSLEPAHGTDTNVAPNSNQERVVIRSSRNQSKSTQQGRQRGQSFIGTPHGMTAEETVAFDNTISLLIANNILAPQPISALSQQLKSDLSKCGLNLNTDMPTLDETLSAQFQEFFDTLPPQPQEKAAFLKEISNALLEPSSVICQVNPNGRYVCADSAVKSIDIDKDGLLKHLIQLPKLCRVFAEQLSMVEIDDANKEIGCLQNGTGKPLKYADFNNDEDTLTLARKASFPLYYKLRFIESDETDEKGKPKRPFNELCRKLAIQAQTKAENAAYQKREELYGALGTWGFYASLNPVKRVVVGTIYMCLSAIAYCRSEKIPSRTTPNFLLQDIISTDKSGSYRLVTGTKTQNKVKKEGKTHGAIKKEIIEQLDARIGWLLLTGGPSAVAYEKRRVLRELRDNINKSANATPAEILAQIKHWKGETIDTASSNASDTMTSPSALVTAGDSAVSTEEPSEGLESSDSSPENLVDALSEQKERLRAAAGNLNIIQQPRFWKSANQRSITLIDKIEEKLNVHTPKAGG